MQKIKWELEDISLQYLDPDGYQQIIDFLKAHEASSNDFMLPGRRLARFHNPKDPRDYLARLDTVLRQKDEIFDLLRQIPQGLTTPAPAEDLPGEY